MRWVTRVLKALGRVNKSGWFLAGWLIGGALSGAAVRLDLAPADPTILWATVIVAAGIVTAWMAAWWLLVERRRPWVTKLKAVPATDVPLCRVCNERPARDCGHLQYDPWAGDYDCDADVEVFEAAGGSCDGCPLTMCEPCAAEAPDRSMQPLTFTSREAKEDNG